MTCSTIITTAVKTHRQHSTKQHHNQRHHLLSEVWASYAAARVSERRKSSGHLWMHTQTHKHAAYNSHILMHLVGVLSRASLFIIFKRAAATPLHTIIYIVYIHACKYAQVHTLHISINTNIIIVTSTCCEEEECETLLCKAHITKLHLCVSHPHPLLFFPFLSSSVYLPQRISTYSLCI